MFLFLLLSQIRTPVGSRVAAEWADEESPLRQGVQVRNRTRRCVLKPRMTRSQARSCSFKPGEAKRPRECTGSPRLVDIRRMPS
ncbi:uncharacterized protein B0H64DRAFT_381113 [Chaetomium fimeti]|uniref:Secreted protein n=1 Tax=Chaetomium fimeti TaxID=1854472 RepID=A0AAE0LWR2_9PEZI|nr:hypothetical protein B0H64DRAFT_381113 [Chaetomium fimeti]